MSNDESRKSSALRKTHVGCHRARERTKKNRKFSLDVLSFCVYIIPETFIQFASVLEIESRIKKFPAGSFEFIGDNWFVDAIVASLNRSRIGSSDIWTRNCIPELGIEVKYANPAKNSLGKPYRRTQCEFSLQQCFELHDNNRRITIRIWHKHFHGEISAIEQ